MSTAKQYVIKNASGRYLTDNMMFLFSVNDALFFDTEEDAYTYCSKNAGFLSSGTKHTFFKVECVLIIFDEDEVRVI